MAINEYPITFDDTEKTMKQKLLNVEGDSQRASMIFLKLKISKPDKKKQENPS